jgi:beta-phosphoglucomutase
MDGVLCYTEEYHYQAWKAMADRYRVPFEHGDNEQLRGLTRRRSLEVILQGRLLPEEQMLRMMEEKDRTFQALLRNMTPADMAPGVLDLLKEIRAAGLKIGVASASRNVQPVLRRLQIDPYVEAYCDGNITQRSKPDPYPYQYAASALRVSPAECTAIEDSPAGIQSAHAAGMCVIGLGPYERVKQAEAQFDSLAQLDLARLRLIHKYWGFKKRIQGRPASGVQLH